MYGVAWASMYHTSMYMYIHMNTVIAGRIVVSAIPGFPSLIAKTEVSYHRVVHAKFCLQPLGLYVAKS